ASGLSAGGRTEIHGVPCDVVEARLDDAGRRVEWAFGVEDHLPRQMRRWFRSARGSEVELTLTVSNLQVNSDLDAGVFEIATPEGFRVETVGKRPPRALNIGDPCPDWELTGSDGKIHQLSDYRGKLVLLDFWASTCPHCRRSMPAMQKIHDTYSGRGVALFALNCRDRGNIDPVAFVRDQGYSYFVADGNTAAIDYSVRGIPAFFVIDGEGRLLHRDTGYNEEKEQRLIGIIERYLDEQGR
ncbi:MAG: TlpA family protein disulfide reductase, partial [Planctomycetota bacterium]